MVHPIRSSAEILGMVHEGDYQYFQICVARHKHHHNIEIDLKCKKGDANLYISKSTPHPHIDDCTWLAAKIGDDFIKIPTYVEDYQKDKTKNVFIGVFGRTDASFALTVNIKDINDKEVRKRFRGEAPYRP